LENLWKELDKLYSEVPNHVINTIVAYVNGKYVPIDEIEARIRRERTNFYDAFRSIPVIEPQDAYYTKLLRDVYIPYAYGNFIRPFPISEFDSFFGINPANLFPTIKRTNPAFWTNLQEATAFEKLKNFNYKKRILRARFGGYYDGITVVPLQSLPNAVKVSPYDIEEILGILSDKGAYPQPLVERASGFTRDDINKINVEKAIYESDGITVYEVRVVKGQVTQSRFFLHLQKAGKPGVQAIYDNLAKLLGQSVYSNLYGVGTDSWGGGSGRNSFATDRVFYSTEADLIKSGVSKRHDKTIYSPPPEDLYRRHRRFS